MIENLTVAVTCRCMVYESDLENFLHNRNLPKIKLSIGNNFSDFQFNENMQTTPKQTDNQKHHDMQICTAGITETWRECKT